MNPADPSLIAKAKALATFTIAYNLIEAGVAIAFGIQDGALSLFGFGLDSLLEAASGVVVYWQVSGASGEREARAEKAIGALLMALAVALGLGAAVEAWQGKAPDTTLPSILVALVSLAVMGWLYKAKLAVARAMDSKALLLDAFCTKSCMWLSVFLLAGAGAYAWLGWRYLDPLATAGMAWLMWHEGREAFQDEDCSCGHDHGEKA